MAKTPVTLKPVAGFCIKSSTLQPTFYIPAPPPQAGHNLLEPESSPIPVPIGLKVFINIAWDAHVPPPPEGSEEAIQIAMKGEDIDGLNPDGWFVPVVVSQGRQDKDKAGGPCLVFDCIYNTSVRSRALIDPEFKIFLIELALQRLEAQASLVLSRNIATPNIASKGKLLPRTVFMPSFLVGNPSPTQILSTPTPKKSLIEEITQPTSASTQVPSKTPTGGKPKGILKASISNSASSTSRPKDFKREKPTWTWAKEGSRLRIVISTPVLARSVIEQATLDLEPRRFILKIPEWPTLDVNLDLSDAEVVATAPPMTSVSLHGTPDEGARDPNNILTLKRQRNLDVDGTTAEWRVAESTLVILA